MLELSTYGSEGAGGGDASELPTNMADEIFVINVGGYIGSSTRSEIEYAQRTGKAVKYLFAQGV